MDVTLFPELEALSLRWGRRSRRKLRAFPVHHCLVGGSSTPPAPPLPHLNQKHSPFLKGTA